jgi:hypothetical protein
MQLSRDHSEMDARALDVCGLSIANLVTTQIVVRKRPKSPL